MKIFFKLFICSVFLIPVVSSASIIKNIDISGNDKISRGTILSNIPYEVSDNFEENSTDLLIETLYKTGFFKKINVSFNVDKLIINVEENPVIKFFAFLDYDDGNDVLSEEVIEKILKNFEMNIGSIFKKSSLIDLTNNLKKLYIDKGFYNISITENTSVDKNNRIGIELKINEGERARISSIKISGNNFFDQDELLDNFKIGEPDFFLINFFTKKDLFDNFEFEAGIESILNKYTDAGFLDIKISSKEVKLSDDKENVDISLFLDEGKRYEINEIIFKGDIEPFNKDFLYSKLSISAGDIISRKEVLKSIKDLNSQYTNEGYVFTKISSAFVPIPNDNKLDVFLEVDKGLKFYVNRINISGNTRTQDSVIRRELKIYEGQLYSKKDILDSVTKIKRLGFFSNVDYKIQRSISDNTVNLNINVEETKTGEFSVGLSHSNATGPSLNAGISQRNILGTGNTFNATFKNSKAVEEVSVYFSDPFFNEQRHKLSYGFFTKSLDASNLDLSSYLIEENGVNLGYGIPISESSNINAEIRLSDLKITCGAIFASSSYEQDQCSSSDSLDNNISISYVKNSLNDFYAPTDGMKSSIQLTSTTPLSDFKYTAFDMSYKDYQPITNELTFNITSKLNIATGYDGKELPFFKRYYSGGSSSVRGFDFNSLGAKYLNGAPKGGESSLLTTIAVIAPAEALGIDQENIRLSAFIDTGSVNEKISQFELDQLRSSTGIALSWLTPIGPIGFNAAYPILKKDSDSTESFSFELGTTF